MCRCVEKLKNICGWCGKIKNIRGEDVVKLIIIKKTYIFNFSTPHFPHYITHTYIFSTLHHISPCVFLIYIQSVLSGSEPFWVDLDHIFPTSNFNFSTPPTHIFYFSTLHNVARSIVNQCLNGSIWKDSEWISFTTQMVCFEWYGCDYERELESISSPPSSFPKIVSPLFFGILQIVNSLF